MSISSDIPIAKKIIRLAHKRGVTKKRDLILLKNEVCREFSANTFGDMLLLKILREMEKNGEISKDNILESLFQKRRIRTLSGIAPISVLLPPAPCNSACVYCPSERSNAEGKTLFHLDTEKKRGPQIVPKKYRGANTLVMPKSYLSSEPGATRALLAGFDPFVQITRRLASLKKTGHSPEKCELIVQGGTFSDVPKTVRTRFLTRCFQAFNGNKNAKTLAAAQKENESAEHRVIGLTLETRPGCITPAEVVDFRRLGCTRVELGVQTLDDEITRKTRRLQTRAEVVIATKLLREAGFKISYHMMPNLPFSTPEKDRENFREICKNSDFKPDLVKIYPCSVVPFAPLKKWFDEGKFVPYSPEVMFDLLYDLKKMTPSWMRISRLIRDIPSTAIIEGNTKTNLNQMIDERAKKRKEHFVEIRSREVRDQIFSEQDARLVVKKYEAAKGIEYLLSFELADETLLAMLRLRIPDPDFRSPFVALRGAGLVRELHTFGIAKKIGERNKKNAQHIGFGKRLLEKSETLCRAHHLSKIAVISGVGVKEFYRKRGFLDEAGYMTKVLNAKNAFP